MPCSFSYRKTARRYGFQGLLDLRSLAHRFHGLSAYVEAKDNREVVDIAQLNAELKTTVARIDQLRKDIDAIVAEIEGEELEA